ncbi:dermonecrotic toxin domain-containing protein [Pseudomonas sp. HMWF021]|uniref:dermonecrotic toxin domain-containing protein n=1 Tax=Pseudomonas sp. HMWF021 TaxID=2056857 RepID=UPI0026C50D1E
MHQIIKPAPSSSYPPTFETVRIWEYPAHYVELAGSLMISHQQAYLYTPAEGTQVLTDYQDLRNTLLSKFSAPGHEDELFGLLSLEERKRFIGFHAPQVTGEVISGDLFGTLFDNIVGKQQQNIDYALQVFRHSDGAVDIHALFDITIDIRLMINRAMTRLDTGGRWSTQPVLTGNQQPSMVQADKAAAAVKTYTDIETTLKSRLMAQPNATPEQQRAYLESLKPDVAHAMYVGLGGEARQRVNKGTLHDSERAIVEAVVNADLPTRRQRVPINGFRPDAFWLTLQSTGQTSLAPLAQCMLITERGGLDAHYSGRAILWTPAMGLEVFNDIDVARQAINRRLLDNVQRLSLLENLAPEDFQPNQQYSLGPLHQITNNVLHHSAQSAINHYLSNFAQVRERIKDESRQTKALTALSLNVINTNLNLAAEHAQAIRQQQTLPAWFGMAPVAEQKRHVELLEQWRLSVPDDKDYLEGIESLTGHVRTTLRNLLNLRIPGHGFTPDQIKVVPNLALAGPPLDLVNFALNHISVGQNTGFSVHSTTDSPLPDKLDQTAVTQLLLSLNIASGYAAKITQALTIGDQAAERRQRFYRQLPWQLLQHAHALKLQQSLSTSAFDHILQVLDMPDGLARSAVEGANAFVSPLTLVKTAGAAGISALGLYVFGSGTAGPLTLYAPYADKLFQEFENPPALIRALNTAGPLQNLLLRRLPEAERAIFRGLLESTAGQTSEITLSLRPVTGNFLHTLYDDGVDVLKQLLGSQSIFNAHTDWEAAKTLFSSGIKFVAEELPGKLACAPFLWESYKAFKDSAEALQSHHWSHALKAFIDGAAQMVSMGLLPELSKEPTAAPLPASDGGNGASRTRKWSGIDPVAPARTQLQAFEAPDVALKDLTKSSSGGPYSQASSNRHFAAIDGKVYAVEKPSQVWQLSRHGKLGPRLKTAANRLIIDPERHIVHYGKAISRMVNEYNTNYQSRLMMNIEAQGMRQIRQRYRYKADVLVQAIDIARKYAFYFLHNLALLDPSMPDGRSGNFIRSFFDLRQLDRNVIRKIGDALIPLCNALVDPSDDLLNTDRFIVGSNSYQNDVIAFVLSDDNTNRVHFTEHFFDQQLDNYKTVMSQTFDVDAHAQAATLIHEFAHQFCEALDIRTLRAREPFSDLISLQTHLGTKLYTELDLYQVTALSRQTPRHELFTEFNSTSGNWIDLDVAPGMEHVGREILAIANAPNMSLARDAFMDPLNPDVRINIILRNADSIARLICELGRQLDPVP